MVDWNFFMSYVRGALYAIWLVWPWLVGMAVLEWVSPGRKLLPANWLFNTLYIPVYLTVASLALYPVTRLVEPHLPANLLRVDLHAVDAFWMGPLVLVYLLVFDFLFYWFHRAQHSWPFMWRYHRFHHSDPNVGVTSATRHHWLEEAMRYFFISAPLVILVGHPEAVLPWLGILIGVEGMFIHWNTRIRLGPLTKVIVGPQYHRIHHSFAAEHVDKNFAVIFPVWDRLFATQHLPVGDEFPVTGVADVARPNGWRLLLPWPAKTA